MSTKFSVIVPVSDLLTPDRYRSLDWVYNRWTKYFQDDVEICFGRNSDEPFNRSKARNVAVERSSHDILVIADADTAFDYVPMKLAVEGVDNAPWIIPYGNHSYYNLTKEYSGILLTRDALDPINDLEWEFKITSWAGLLVMNKTDFYKVGGYDERFKGWGWEDVAFRVKLDHEIGRHCRISHGRAMHIWHERGNDEFNSPQELANRKLFDTEYRQKYNWRDERYR